MTLRRAPFDLLFFAALALAVGGCGQQERETLKERLTEVEQRLATAETALAAREQTIAELRGRLVETESALAQCTTRGDDNAARIHRLETERDKLRTELKSLKPKP